MKWWKTTTKDHRSWHRVNINGNRVRTAATWCKKHPSPTRWYYYSGLGSFWIEDEQIAFEFALRFL
jgi:hypothetical protein